MCVRAHARTDGTDRAPSEARSDRVEPDGGAPRSRSCDELEALITQHLRIATAILYVALAGELAAVGLL